MCTSPIAIQANDVKKINEYKDAIAILLKQVMILFQFLLQITSLCNKAKKEEHKKKILIKEYKSLQERMKSLGLDELLDDRR